MWVLFLLPIGKNCYFRVFNTLRLRKKLMTQFIFMNMKKYIFQLVWLCLLVFNTQESYAQSDAQQKELKKELKRLEKEGWVTFPGSLPLSEQLSTVWQKQRLKDERGMSVNVVTDAQASANVKSVAEAQAVEFAKIAVAGLIESALISVMEANLSNARIAKDELQSVSELVRQTKNTITTRLGYVEPILKIYRQQGNTYEVSVHVCYPLKQTVEAAKSVIANSPSNKLTGEQLDKLLTLN
jgi:hypothetical protein